MFLKQIRGANKKHCDCCMHLFPICLRYIHSRDCLHLFVEHPYSTQKSSSVLPSHSEGIFYNCLLQHLAKWQGSHTNYSEKNFYLLLEAAKANQHHNIFPQNSVYPLWKGSC